METNLCRLTGKRCIANEGCGRRLCAVVMHQLSATTAMQLRRARKKQFQVVVQLGHRADGGARGTHRIRLVDGDGRRDAADGIHLWLVHALEELPRVGREGFDVAALTFRINGIEGERGFSRTTDPRDDGELAQRQFQREIAQIVLARALYEDPVFHGAGVQQQEW